MFRLVRDKDRDCYNKMRILGQKSIPGLEPKKKKNEDLVKITFTPDRDLDDYLRSKNLLEEKQKKKKQEEPKSEEEKKEEERRRALNIAALLSWSPDEPIIVDKTTTESSDSQCNREIETTQDECQNTREADEKRSEYNENNNNEMTEVEIEAAYEDLCAEISQEYVPVEDKGKDSFWPNSLQNKFSRARNVDVEFSKMEREEERKCKMTEVKFEEEEFMRMEEHHHQHQHNQHNQHQLEEEEFVRMEEQEDEEWAPSSPTEEWIGVVVEEVGPLFSRPFSPRAPTSVTPEPTRDYCSTERALNSEPRDDNLRSNPLAKKPPLPATGLPTHGLTMHKLPTQLKIPIFTKPQQTTSNNNENGQRPITTIKFGDENNKIPLFSRPLSPEAVQQWTADMKRRDSFGSSSCSEARSVKYSEKENSQMQQQTFRTSQQQSHIELYTGHSL